MNRSPYSSLYPPVLPWIFWSCFAGANGALSYGSFSLEAKLWIGVIGIFLPMALALRMERGSKNQVSSLVQEEFLPRIPAAAWIFLGTAAIFLRFYQLTSLSLWPLEDEAMNGYYAVELAEKGNWQLTYDFSGMPPLYVWGLGLFFKWFGVSLATLWFFPALLSALAAGLVFGGARHFFSRSLSYFFTGLWALSFWPLYAGRFSVQGGFLLFWMALTFYGLGLFCKAKDEKSKGWSSLLLGLCAGAGFYTFTSWAVVALALTLFIFYRTVLGRDKDWRGFLFFFIPEVFLFLILAWVTLTERGGHFQYVLQNPFGGGWPGLNDFCALFWGSRLPPYLFAYRPFWGGFLNPLAGALSFWGALVLSRAGFALWKQGILLALFILPGFLTGGLDGHRVIQIAPLLLLTAALGLASLVSTIARPQRFLVGAVILLLSCGLDARHLLGVYHSVWTAPRDNWFASKSVERLRAFSILEEARRKKGPGLILTEFFPDGYDQSLSVLTTPFNAALNPKIDPKACQWAGLITNVHFQSYLTRQYPEARWFELSAGIQPPEGGWVLGLMPLPLSNARAFHRAILADQAFHSLAGLVFDNHDWKNQKPVLERLSAVYPLMKGDPFLESCFWERVAECDYQDRDYPGQVEALQKALARGIPAAHLYNNLGALWLRGGQKALARDAFKKALLCSPNRTSAAAGLAALDDLEKKGVRPRD